HALEIEKVDRIVHVADVGQRDKIETCITGDLTLAAVKGVDSGVIGKGSLLGDLASKIWNIDGKILGKDGKPMVARRCVWFADTAKVTGCGDGRSVEIDDCMTNPSSHDEARLFTPDQQKVMVHEDGICIDPVMNEPNSHINEASMVQNSAVRLPLEAMDEIKARFVNTLYG
ncbi:hypothetical protein Tco_1267592, partial [Tanacetum coccineum]